VSDAHFALVAVSLELTGFRAAVLSREKGAEVQRHDVVHGR
jgi:hypothetical protein